ncbi:DVU_1551 family NTP transferase [Halodesulfovibrio sp.]|jgi:CTP:molybdopterin cytidylyltransferase MocA|uniref:DVU_1551 family NTP transferase n=1 Tax=Halodesulfovibrio sp. TaxID=1912772 RepID=UPI0025F0928D|nr:NTP transferase domain-containing protein [Halodesulfovibrio sp.]MCT4626483.1 NTP transferase domain-containing protein [Halodesulfovibrio sp.]
MPKAYAIILAAGYSQRMGQCKAVLPLGEKSALQTLADTFIQAGVTPIVVTGYAKEPVKSECNRLGLQTVHNAQFDSGMYSSVQAGCTALPDDAEIFFVTPVDIPLIRSRTIAALLQYAQTTEALVIHPVLDAGIHTPFPDSILKSRDYRGHPPCLDISIKNDILAYNGDGGLAQLLNRFTESTQYLSVIDSNMMQDMDTPQDYETICHLHAVQSVPSLEECYAIWNAVKLPEAIRRHSIAVTDIARIMLKGIPAATQLFSQTVIAGAMLHDIAKGQAKHASAGAKLIAELGFPALAECIANHSHMTAQKGAITEAELVFLADKFVTGTTRCTLEHRYQQKMAMFADSPEAVTAIRQKLLEAQAILAKVETVTCADYNTLLADEGEH